MTKDNHSPRRYLRPSSPGRAIALGAAVLVLLGLVAAASRAHRTPGGHGGGHTPPAAVGDYLFSIVAVLVVGFALVLIYAWLTERDVLVEHHQNQKGTLRALTFLLALALVGTLIARVHGELRGIRAPNLGQGAGARTTGAKRPGDGERAPEFKWLPVVLASGGALVALGVVGARSLRRERRGLEESFLLEQEFEELLEDTLADLYGETDPRRAIIAAYARVERLFGSFGLPRDPSEAPVEYLERVLPELRASGSALRRLTRLFERAKFSTHDVDDSMRNDAIAALIQVRDELRASRIEDVA
jgi:hypothetical protein